LELKQKYAIYLDDIADIEIHVGPFFSQLVHYPDPKNAEEARFSIEHSLVAAFLEETLVYNLDAYTDEKALDQKFKKSRTKIRVIVHPDRESSAMGGTDLLIIKLKNGKEFRKECEKPKGVPPLYLSYQEVFDKFKACTRFAGFLTETQIDSIGEMVYNLENLKDMARLMKILAFAQDRRF